MNLHEYQAKSLFNDYGIPTPAGEVAETAEQAVAVAQKLGGSHWVIKAQVHSGGRGKVGGVRVVDNLDEVRDTTDALIGKYLVTHQTTEAGLPIHRVLVELPTSIAREIYLAVLVDRVSRRVVFMVSAQGGMDIETVAEQTPAAILHLEVDPAAGLQGYQCRQAGFFLGFNNDLIKQLTKLMHQLYQLFLDKDASLVEINPLVVTTDERLLAIDAKINLDDSSLYRHPDMQQLFDASQENPVEVKAHQFGLNYIALDGNVACMVNGAGLAMATMDLIQNQGGTPANFLDVGGGTTSDRVAEAFKIIVSDSKVKSILVNIFGGIVRCDLIAEGIIQAAKEVQLTLPVVVRLEGTNAELGQKLLAESEMNILVAQDLTEAATLAVAAAQQEA